MELINEIEVGSLVALKGRGGQWQRNTAEYTSAGICIRINPIGAETHLYVQRVHHGPDEFDTIDAVAMGSAGQIIAANEDEDRAILKDLHAPGDAHLKPIPIAAITTSGWVLIRADPFIGDTHWVPGSFRPGDSTPYFWSPLQGDKPGEFKAECQGYALCDPTIQTLRRYGVEINESGSSTALRTSDFLN
jgi:hypothetical protein